MPWNEFFLGISTCLEMYSLWYPIATDWRQLEQLGSI
jgi:hypothetical protein